MTDTMDTRKSSGNADGERKRAMAKPPPYDTLVVGAGIRHAYRDGVRVDERTGEPLGGTVTAEPAGKPDAVPSAGPVPDAFNKADTPRLAPEQQCTCAVCGVTFTAHRRHARTCSMRCRKWVSRRNVYLRRCASWATPEELQGIAQRFQATYWPKGSKV